MPEKIGQYSVVSQIGRGGMGVVYKARDESLHRFVAIKVLNDQLAGDSLFLQRFIREAQAAAALSHPNIVQIYYIGEDNGHPYFVMEYVPGRSLDELLRTEGRVDNPRASQIVLQAAHGLAAAHDQGIIHRDIKPANLILDDRGLVKIADFGLALPADSQTQLTATGMFVGTPGYLAPEQCAGEKADNRTDIYALGVSFYLLLTGTPPFRGDSPLALLKQIMDAEPADVSSLNPNVDATTRGTLKKMIAKDRAQRYQNCHELIADLDDYLARSGVRSMTAGLAAKTPSSRPELAAAAAAPTLAIASSANPKTDAGAPATMIQAKTAPATLPDAPLAAPDTLPDLAAQPTGSTSRAAIVIMVLGLALLLGGGVAAAVFGTKIYHSLQARWQQPAAVTAAQDTAGKTPAAAPKAAEGVLLSQTITLPPAMTSSQSPQSAPPPDVTVTAAPPRANRTATATAATTATTAMTATAPTTHAAAAEKRVAAVEKPRARAGVAIAATGDAALSGAVSSVLRSELESAGLEVSDAQTLPATESLLRRGDVSAARLIDQLSGEGYAVLLLARIDPTGQRELSYYGRHDTLYTSRVTVTAYDLATGKPFGSSGSASIDYTSLNADSKAEEAVGPLARSAASAIRSH